MTEEQDPFSAFDWYFTDVSEEHAARLHALKDKSLETSILMKLLSADSIVHFALWSELPDNHPVGQLWLETQIDLLSTIYLAYGGFFRQALTVLRAWFEIALHGVFFSAHFGQSNGRYEQWRSGQRNAPAKMQEIARALASRSDKLVNTSENEILGVLDSVYSFLSMQTHAQGLDVYDLQEGRDNVPRYLPKSFNLWYENVLKAFDALCFVYRIFYTREIATYLKNSKPEMQRVQELNKTLSKLMPNFGMLIQDVIAYAK